VNAWRAILAALVIFAAGVVTGGLTVRLNKLHEVPAPASPAPGAGGFGFRQRGELLDRMQRQLYLSAEQRAHIEQILRDNHDHMRQLWESIAPQAEQERRRVHDLIMAELKPEQQKRFEEVFRGRGPFHPGEGRWREDHRDQKLRKQETAASTNSAKTE
jgi:hypothetical protein